jgi:RNA recognition motif-containing protein
MPSQIDSETVKNRIADILARIENEADPQQLNEYRSIFKKQVSFTRRSYVAAYLLMQLDQGKAGRSPGAFGGGKDSRTSRSRSFSKSGAGARSGETPRRDAKDYPLSEEDSVRLFISAGRNRRVFPREILGLINTKTAIPKDDIGAIRILDNYSFVQVRNTVADEIIEALNGKPFRGRTLSVNYARIRKDDEFPDPKDDFDKDDLDEGGDVPERESPETFADQDGGEDIGEADSDETRD